jgi:hypothetical protein
MCGAALVYQNSICDNIDAWPSLRTFNNAYCLLCLPSLTSKNREMAFQILNSTIWTNNKAFTFRMRKGTWTVIVWLSWNNGALTVLCASTFCSWLVWLCLGEITTHLNIGLNYLVPWVQLGPFNLIFNLLHPSLLIHIHDEIVQSGFILLIRNQKIHHLQKHESAFFSPGT